MAWTPNKILLNPTKCQGYSFYYFFLSFAKKIFLQFFYPSYVSICKDLQKTIVLSSDPFLQVFTFTIQCIRNPWWSGSSPSRLSHNRVPPKTCSKSTGEHLMQKHDSNKAAAMHLDWNHTTAWVPPLHVDLQHMP